MIVHVKQLTRREAKFSEVKSLKKKGVELMIRFLNKFGPTEAAMMFHLAFVHGPEDLRWGYLQGVYSFESYWGYLGNLI